MAAKSKRQQMVDLAVLAPLDWIDERTGAVRGTKWFLFRNVPRDVSWMQTLGSASLTAFIVGQLVDAFVFRRIKRATGDKRIWLRATGSTVISQLIDSVVVNGTNGDDLVEVVGAGTGYSVVGLHTMVQVRGSEGAHQ